jgi:cytochrome c5
MTASILIAACSLAACAGNGNGNGNGREDIAESSDIAINGASAYQEYCARCHESGTDSAPRTGHPEDWEVRSSLWQAVLMEHAKKGFLDMPARGGNAQLPDDVVNAAAQYMLEQTFPNMPRD